MLVNFTDFFFDVAGKKWTHLLSRQFVSVAVTVARSSFCEVRTET